MTHPLDVYLANNPGETLKALAERADVSRMQMWRLINGRGEFTSTFLRKIANATNGQVTVLQLVDALEKSKQPKKPGRKLARAS